jgi:hypothetical protein
MREETQTGLDAIFNLFDQLFREANRELYYSRQEDIRISAPQFLIDLFQQALSSRM